jgi:hypothetical protein
MRSTLVRIGVAAGLVLAVMTVRLGVPQAFAGGVSGHDKVRFVYAAKVLCTPSGDVTTTINVHNPEKKAQTVTKKGIALDVGQVATAPGTPVQDTLNPDWAFQMGCGDLGTLGAVGPAGFGDVILESSHELDVWAVYLTGTSGGGTEGGGGGTVSGTEVVRVPASRHEGSGRED